MPEVRASTSGVLAEEEPEKEYTNRSQNDRFSVNSTTETGILKIYYNNCNGLQPGELLKANVKEKINKKRKNMLQNLFSIPKFEVSVGL